MTCADDEVQSLREQNAKLRDDLATLVFQQCLVDNPPRQPLPDPRHPPPSTSQLLRQDSGLGSVQNPIARTPSANLAQSLLFRAPSNTASQMLGQPEQTGAAQSTASGQQGMTQQLSQQLAEERRRFGLAINAKDDRIKELAEQLSAIRQKQKAESSSYQGRYVKQDQTNCDIHSRFSCMVLCMQFSRLKLFNVVKISADETPKACVLRSFYIFFLSLSSCF